MFRIIRLTAAAVATGSALLLGLAAPASAADVNCPDATAPTVECTNTVEASTSGPSVQYTTRFTITPNDIIG